MTTRPNGHGVGCPEALGLWARIGVTGFGGPAGQIAPIHRLVAAGISGLAGGRWLAQAFAIGGAAALVLAAVALIAMVRYKVGMLPTLAASAVVGGLWFTAAR